MKYVYVVTYRATIRATQNAAKAADIAMQLAGAPPSPRRREQLARRLRQALPVRVPSSLPASAGLVVYAVAEKVYCE